MDQQTTSTILMVRPYQFQFNEQTASNNYYQKVLEGLDPKKAQARAEYEFDNFVQKLRDHQVDVVVIQDQPHPVTPDAVFPNNWISFHSDGRVALYPMYAPNRRLERRHDILEILRKEHGYKITQVNDYSATEDQGQFLEGTGSLVLDRVNKIAYAAISLRTDSDLVDKFCEDFGYRAVKFTANQTVNGERLPIYHTNVMMNVGGSLAIICADTIDHPEERSKVLTTLKGSGKTVVTISEDQKLHFAGNMLEVVSKDGIAYLVMSAAAHKCLDDAQKKTIEQHCKILSSSLDTLEALGGGSARCMMAEVFLPKN